MNQAIVSVVVPVYNTGKYLRKCVDSLVSQTYRDTEIILVNDGSTDESLQICKEYEKKYNNIKIIDQPNMGVSAARNAGILVSEGNYITFVDSDDTLSSDAIKIMYDLINKHNVDIVSAAMVSENKKSCSGDEFTYSIHDGDAAILWCIKDISSSICAKLFNKQSIKGIFFDENRKVNEDGFFLFECCIRQLKILDCNKIIYWYSERLDSSSRESFSDKFLDILYFVEKKKEYIYRFYPQYKSEFVKLEVKTNLNLLHLLCNTNESKYRITKKCCCKFIRKHPFINIKSFLKYQKILYLFVQLGMYWAYQFLIRKVIQK